MVCCSCGKEVDINYGREYWNGIYCKKCADEMLSTPEYIKIYKRIIADLQAENAALKERLEKAVELREPRITVDHWGGLYEVVYEKVQVVSEVYDTRSEAEARLAELKGEKK